MREYPSSKNQYKMLYLNKDNRKALPIREDLCLFAISENTFFQSGLPKCVFICCNFTSQEKDRQ